MNTNEKKKLSPLEAADLPTGSYRAGFRIKAVIPGVARGSVGRRRILGAEVVNCYHVMSRTAGGDMLFDPEAKEAFCKIMRRLENFAGVEILTYAVMSNHFHLLVRVPDRERFLERFEGEGGEERLLEHLKLLYSKAFLKDLRWQMAELRKRGLEAEVQELLGRFKERMCRLEPFMKELKQRFARWFNKHHSRRGTLWMDRYKSVIVENGEALRTMAAYIDLNPVRAGLCDDPKAYRWCGYAEALGGSKRARRGLCRVMGRPLDSWAQRAAKTLTTGAEWYRAWLFEEGREQRDEEGNVKRRGLDRETVERVKKKGGKLSRPQLLRCRVRYFTDGVAIGSKSFIEHLFRERRECFGPKRRNGARPIVEAHTELCSIRALRVQAVE